MPIRHIATTISDLIIKDEIEGGPSLINIYYNIKAAQLPVTKNPLWVCVQLTGAEGAAYRVTLEGPGDQLMTELANGQVASVTLDHEYQQYATVLMMKGSVRFESYGVYSVCLYEGNQLINRHHFGVFPAPAPPGDA